MESQIAKAAAAGYKHYVYGLLRKDTAKLFYVGKGVRNRVFAHEEFWSLAKTGNLHKKRIIERVGISGYCFFGAFDSHDSAIAFEQELILSYGIERHGGDLVNDTLGGDGLDAESAAILAKAAWDDPESGLRKFWASKEADPIKAASVARMRQAYDPEKQRELVKQLWQDEEWAKNRVEIMHVFWASDEGAALKAEKRRRWSEENPMFDDETRSKVGKASRDFSNRPDVIEKRREAALKHKVASRPEVREKIRTAALSRDRERFACTKVEWNGRIWRLPELCEHLGTTPTAFHSYRHDHGCDVLTAVGHYATTTPLQRKHDAHATQVEAARQRRLKDRTLYVNGEALTLHAAAKAVGRAASTIRDYAKRHAITLQDAIDHYAQITRTST